MIATIGAVAALVALSSGAAALVFSLWPGLRPTPPPDKLSASIGKLAVEPGVGFGEYLARVGALNDYRHLRSDVVESVNTPRLLPGSRDPKVKTLQLLLTQQGLYSGAPNGVFGPSTVRAVKKFQKQTNVVPDGIVGPQTLQALIKANPTSFTKPGVLVFVGVKVEGFRVRQFGPLQANLYDSATDVRVQGRGAVPIVQLLRPLLPPEKVKAAVRLGSITKSRATVRPDAPIDQRGKLLWVAAPRNAGTFFVRVELHDLSGELIDFADTSTFRLPIRR